MSRPPRTSADRSANHIRESERRFRRLALLAPVGVFETDAEGNCLFANEKWCELAGMSAEQARGRGWVAALHPDDREKVFREWYGAASEGRDFSSECRFVVSGRVRWLQGTARGVRDPSGRITHYIGTVTPIDARKAIESALRATEARLDAVLASIGDYLVTYDHEWRFTYVNDAAARLLRLPVEELLGRSVWEVFPEAIGGRHHQELQQAVQEQRVIRSAMLVLPLPGSPYRNMPRPELIAGPSFSNIDSLMIKSANASRSSSSVACCLAMLWASMALR